jgi:uncharacterized protein YndB with AHSA1/START domain
MPDGRVDVKGEVRESEPSRKLVVTWDVDWFEPKLPECIVTYEIEPVGRDLSASHHDRSASDANPGASSGRRAHRLAHDSVGPQVAIGDWPIARDPGAATTKGTG